MSCTKEEIAEKRRIAIEKLRLKKLNQAPVPVANSLNSLSLLESGSSSSSLKPNAFYGQPNSSKSSPSTCQQPKNILNSNQNQANNKDTFLKTLNNNKTSYTSGSPNRTNLASVFQNKLMCNVSLVNENRFTVEMPKFNQKLIDVFKKVPSSIYDPSTKSWTFKISDYEVLLNLRKELRPDIILNEIPKNVLKLFSTPKDDLKQYNSCLASIEPKLTSILLPFQKEGICFGISKHGRVLIADEMGLGKTIQALGIADFYKEDWPMLICTTASTRNTWMKHIRDYLPNIACHHTVCLTDGQQSIYDSKIVVTSYSLLEKQLNYLVEKSFGVIIFDESHSLKNHEAKRTNNCDRLARQAKRIIMLTGTPALSRPVELYSQLQMIDRSFLTFKAYTIRYCEGKQGTFGWDSSGQSNLTELNVVLNRKFMIRRIKDQVLPGLADKNRETVLLDASLIELDDSLKSDFSKYESKLSQSKKDNDILLVYYAKTAQVKAKAVCSYIKGLLQENKKFLVFAHHKIMMDAIHDCLKKCKVGFIRIDGTTRNDIRNENINQFQNKENCQVALLSLHSCNAGITLTAAQLVVFAELDWNPSTLAQAESRAHRIGQLNVVTCRYLLAPNTADDLIWKMLNNKQKVLSNAGLFAEDIQSGDVVKAPKLKSPIEKYLTKTIRQVPSENETISSETSSVVVNSTNAKRKIDTDENVEAKKLKNETCSVACDDDFSKLLDDDEDFGDLDF